MNIKDAAIKLLSSMRAPKGSVNVLMKPNDPEAQLLVWVDKSFNLEPLDLPNVFEGYKVKVEVKPLISAH
jgi:hypothetical protein